MIRCEMIFVGHVQGVGFRCTAREIARRLELRGRVRNDPDGSVSLVAEGPEDRLEALAEQLRTLFTVRGFSRTCSPARGEYADFDIEC